MEKIEDRTYRFALQVVKLVRVLPKETASRAIGQQLIRSGTSIGANVEEAIGGTSKREFANKMNIAQKEAGETHYWLRLIRDLEIVKSETINPLIQEAYELRKVLAKIVSTTRKNLAQTRPTVP